MSDTVISINGLGKRYKLGETFRGPSYETLRDKIAETFKTSFRRPPGKNEESEPADARYFWALKDISLDVRQGNILGIIGRNGAGKTTLLKILTQITDPTEGEIRIKGRVASLLEVGTGFHPELTGRENIFMNGAILGMTRAEIKRKFDKIVDFAEVEKFVDTPVKRYSVGMRVRLAFSVAAHLEPEILLVDEVLAVGDLDFQRKCLGRMGDVSKEGRTILFVSHKMEAIIRLCEKAVWIDQGRMRMLGPTEQVVQSYLTSGANLDGQCVWRDGIANSGVDEFKIKAIRIINSNGEVTGLLDTRKPFWIEIEYEILKRLPFCRVGFGINTVEGIRVFTAYDTDCEKYIGPREPGRFVSKCKIPGHLLSPGGYSISSAAGITGVKNLALLENVLLFDIEDTGAVGSDVSGRRQGVIRPRLEWQREPI